MGHLPRAVNLLPKTSISPEVISISKRLNITVTQPESGKLTLPCFKKKDKAVSANDVSGSLLGVALGVINRHFANNSPY